MYAPLIAAASSMVSTHNESWVLVAELTVATRIPDLVAVRINPEAVERRLQLGLGQPVSLSESKVMTALSRRQWRSAEQVARSLGVTSAYVRQTMRSLCESGHARSRDGGFRLHPELSPIVSRCVSFEAKRSDWRGALVQARAHLEFANSSYVAFDQAFESRYRNARDYFKKAKVGLVRLSDNGTFARLLASRSSRTNAFVRSAMTESLLARMQGLPRDPLPETRLPNAVAPNACQESVMLAGHHSRSLGRLVPAAVFV